MKIPYRLFCAMLTTPLLASCGAGDGAPPPPSTTPTSHQVTVTWTASREAAVNKAGGGYKVSITGQPLINVSYVSGPSTATSTTLTLMSGSYTGTVTAYSAYPAIDPNTGQPTGSASVSLPTPITINVPY